MFKYQFCFLIIFSFAGIETACSQTSTDSAETIELIPDSLHKPVAGNGDFLLDSVRQVSQRQVNSYLTDPDYAYANDPEYWKKKLPQDQGAVRWIILSAVFALVLFGIHQLVKENDFSWLVRKGKQTGTRTADTPPDKEADYDAVIRKFHEEGNYRLAIRYMYLRLIRTAREKSGIQFRDSSTNAEIARAFGNNPLAGEFRFLSMAYEYIFYGGFLPKPELYDTLKNKFETFQQTLTV
jgi:hypothetical protein